MRRESVCGGVEETLVWLRGWLNVVYLEIYIHVRRRIHVCTCEEEDTWLNVVYLEIYVHVCLCVCICVCLYI